MNIDDATLMAYLDGELDAEGVAQVEAAKARDPQLAASIARQQRQDARLRTSHAAAAEAPIPDALMQLVLGHAAPAPAPDTAASGEAATPGNVVALRPRKRARVAWSHLGALAAGIVLAVIALPMLRDAQGGADWKQGADGLRASGALAQALDRQLASETSGKVRIALSFRNQAGQYCRTFRVDAASTAGLACRDGQGWSLPVLASQAQASSGELRQAATPLPAVVLDAVDASIAGDALDAQDEQAARQAGWR